MWVRHCRFEERQSDHEYIVSCRVRRQSWEIRQWWGEWIARVDGESTRLMWTLPGWTKVCGEGLCVGGVCGGLCWEDEKLKFQHTIDGGMVQDVMGMVEWMGAQRTGWDGSWMRVCG